jgi:hypothetical protein
VRLNKNTSPSKATRFKDNSTIIVGLYIEGSISNLVLSIISTSIAYIYTTRISEF